MTGGKKNPQAGTRFEIRVRDFLTERGWVVVRSPASKGPFDLMAMRGGAEPIVLPLGMERLYGSALVQCKVNGWCSPSEWNALLELAERAGAMALVAYRAKRKVYFNRLMYRKSGIPGEAQPWVAWSMESKEMR